MALSPVSGTPSAAQLAVMEQIRALRAAKTGAPVQATATVRSAAPAQAKSAPAQPPAAQALTTTTAASGAIAANRPRGSILNILA